MNAEIKNAISAADVKAQYDNCAKRLIGQKIILAHILVKTVDDFKGMKPMEVVPYIVGTPYIGTVPAEPGLTNAGKDGQRLVSLNTENEEIDEGLIKFDIIFYVRMRNELSQIIINIEIQKDEPSKYKILNRAIFYTSRLISSQKERDFVNSDYDSIKKVYSIWLCLNMRENSMNHVHLVDDALIGSQDWKGNLDIFNIVMIGIAENLPEYSQQYELHRLIGALLSQQMTVDEKLNVVANEYKIPVEEDLKEEVNIMCNLSDAVEEKGIEKGIQQGIEQGIEQIILNMQKKGFDLKNISIATGKSEEEIKTILEK